MRVKNIVLVHGSFVDDSGWEGVYKILKKDGYNAPALYRESQSAILPFHLPRAAITSTEFVLDRAALYRQSDDRLLELPGGANSATGRTIRHRLSLVGPVNAKHKQRDRSKSIFCSHVRSNPLVPVSVFVLILMVGAENCVLCRADVGIRVFLGEVGIPAKPNAESGMNPNGIPG